MSATLFIASEGGLSLLSVNPGLAIWTTITFVLVMVVLQRYAWKPIIKALDERAGKIQADLDRAESVRREAEIKLEDYMQKLNALKEQGLEILEEARKDANRIKEEMLESAKNEAEAMRQRGVRDIELAKDGALEELHKEVVNLSVSIASQVIGRSLKPEDHKRFAEDAIKGLKS
ncbi:MAG: F0F1 ATP synthase subunit B [Spirochaetia bacterium]|nr:F0F1 ATP synthase subunit B [Spirochaetia bacterium]